MKTSDDQRNVDPAEQAAILLFRIGFGILCILLPILSAFSRRAPVVVAPIGAVVLIVSAFLLNDNTRTFARIKAAALSPVGLAMGFVFFWASLSLLWTPFPVAAAERLLRIAGTLVMAFGTILALPVRMRTSNLYLIAFGVGISAILLLLLLVFQPPSINFVTLERSAIQTTLLAWPAVAWLAMKQRSVGAMAIAGGLGTLALISQGPLILPALMIGAIILGGAINNRRAVAVSLMSAVAVLILAAPLVALALTLASPQASTLGSTLQVWADIIVADPLRLLTGHGFETALRNRFSLALDISAPKSLLFEIWYELGLPGAVGTTILLVLVIDRLSHLPQALVPFLLGCFGFSLALAVIGLGTSQTWWLTALATTIIAFAAVGAGESRSDRPKAMRTVTPPQS